ncbi:MAG: hypothetical protein ACHBN1_04050 [Heteroscytonema crispum UTEX LB 1556]
MLGGEAAVLGSGQDMRQVAFSRPRRLLSGWGNLIDRDCLLLSAGKASQKLFGGSAKEREKYTLEGVVNKNKRRLKKLSMHRKVFSFSLH